MALVWFLQVKGKIEGMKKPENVTEDDTPEGASGNGGPTESNVWNRQFFHFPMH